MSFSFFKNIKYKDNITKINFLTKYKKYLIYAIIILVAYIINKKFFLMAIFMILTTIGKVLRQQIGNSMIMFDPLVFFSILIMKYWGLSYLFIYLFITVFLADAIAGHLTEGSILNYALFNLCPYLMYFLLGKTSLMIYGNFTAILYSVSYYFIRVNFMAGDPFQTASKAITNVIFVFLYISFLGPIFELIM